MSWHLRSLTLTIILFSFHVLAEDADPANDGSQYAYAANLGWLNAEPLGDGGPGMSLGDDAAHGWLWSANTGWISLNCENTDSCGTVQYGVAYDGLGRLSGYAWSPNIGWISFSCADSDTCNDVAYGVGFDLDTGEMNGYAYAANAGWVSFSCAEGESCESVEYRVRLEVTPRGPVIFADGFEST